MNLHCKGFRTAGAVPIEVEPGDMIMHNILVLHGSSSCNSPLRRTGMTEGKRKQKEKKKKIIEFFCLTYL